MPTRPTPSRVARASIVLCGVALTGCISRLFPIRDDFSDETPRKALNLTIDRMEEAYSFTRWKRLDWDDIRARLDAEMAAAETADDEDRVFGMLVAELPDGHVYIENDQQSRELCPEATHSLGMQVGWTDEDELVVVAVDAGGPAAQAGLEVRDVLDSIDGLDPADALLDAPMHCSPLGLATPERRRHVALRLMSRVGAGEARALTVAGSEATIELTGVSDIRDPHAVLGLSAAEERVSARMWSPGVGYVALGWEDTVLSERAFRREVRRLWEDGARRLVVDLRNNDGGTDYTAANIAGTFTDREWFYETVTMYDHHTGQQAEVSEVWVEPQTLYWDLPVVALINGNTVSSGEGIAMMLRRFPGVEVVGFEGTAASFGSAGSTTKLPGGWTLSWPAGRSLDRQGRIQLDSDHTGTGGVTPTIRVPSTVDNLVAEAEDPVGFLVDEALVLTGGGR